MFILFSIYKYFILINIYQHTFNQITKSISLVFLVVFKIPGISTSLRRIMNHHGVKIVSPVLNNPEDILYEQSKLRSLLMVGRELKQSKIKKEEPNDFDNVVKTELNTFMFDKELYYKEVKEEDSENFNVGNLIKHEECSNNYNRVNCDINYEDFQLMNEEISIKEELNSGEG